MTESLSLSDLQLAVMRVLWLRGEARVSEVRDDLQAERDLANTTVATLLQRLERRGLVEHHTEGRQFVYRARVSEEEVRVAMVEGMASSLFRGDVAAFVCHLLDDSEMSSSDMAKLRALIEARESGEKGDA